VEEIEGRLLRCEEWNERDRERRDESRGMGRPGAFIMVSGSYQATELSKMPGCLATRGMQSLTWWYRETIGQRVELCCLAAPPYHSHSVFLTF